MPYTLPPLPYAFNALEPHIDAKTMEIHHGKHHQAYINNANKVFEAHPDLGNMPVEELLKDLTKVPEAVRTALRNNAGGHANHALFWTVIGPNGGGEPTGELATAINAAFGNFASFKEKSHNWQREHPDTSTHWNNDKACISNRISKVAGEFY